jgi:hypothetical protein
MSKQKALAAASKMPPLKHNNGEPFDIMQSDVAAWLVEQPEIRAFVFDSMNGSHAIIFNHALQAWHGNPNWKL